MVRANFRHVVTADDAAFKATMRTLPTTAGRAARGVGGKLERMGRQMEGVTRTLGRFTAKLAKTGAIAAGIAIPAAAILGARKLAIGLKAAADLGGRLSDLASQSGAAVKQLRILQAAFEDNGVSGEKVGQTFLKMEKSIDELRHGLSTQVRAFKDLNLSHSDLVRLNPADQFALIQKRIAGLEDPTRRAATAMNIFGRSGGELLTLFADGNALEKAAVTVGAQADILDKNAAKFDRISDLLGSAGSKFQGFFVGALDRVADPLKDLLEKWNQTDWAAAGQALGEKLIPALKRAEDLITKIASGQTTAGGAAVEVGSAAQKGFHGFLKNIGTAIGEKVNPAVEFGPTNAAADKKRTLQQKTIAAILARGDKTGFSDPAFTGAATPAGGATKSGGILGLVARLPQLAKAAGPAGEADPMSATGGGGAKASTGLFKRMFQVGKLAASQAGAALGHFAKAQTLNAGGFGGLASFEALQGAKAAGITPGTGNVFARDRERLGIEAGLRSGGLGATRKIGGKSEEQKALEAQQKEMQTEIGILRSIHRDLTTALTV